LDFFTDKAGGQPLPGKSPDNRSFFVMVLNGLLRGRVTRILAWPGFDQRNEMDNCDKFPKEKCS
jgi:hypothetical protein